MSEKPWKLDSMSVAATLVPWMMVTKFVFKEAWNEGQGQAPTVTEVSWDRLPFVAVKTTV